MQNQSENDKNMNLKHIIQAIYALLTALILVSAAFAIILKINQDDLKQKDLKISMLINEVGEVKQDLNDSSLQVTGLYDQIEDTRSRLINLNNNVIKSIVEKETNWTAIQGELHAAQDSLNNMLAEKESLINELAQKNETLKQELNIVEENPDVMDVLILGKNNNLVDTIMLASANPETGQITLVSIPRDLYHKGRKINELYYAYGVQELEKSIWEITGVYPDKYILFDFNAFVDFIDLLDGIEINVEKALTDYSYPGIGNSYQTVSFNAGTQKMNGDTALRYARSRKSTSDFDRAKRQQQIVQAVKNKAMSKDLLSKLDLATKIYSKISENISSDISFFDALGYLQSYKNFHINGGNVLDSGNYLYSTKNAKGQYILLPVGGHYLEIKKYIGGLINN